MVNLSLNLPPGLEEGLMMMQFRDYIPGWNCWVSAYYTRTAGSQKYCESKRLLQIQLNPSDLS